MFRAWQMITLSFDVRKSHKRSTLKMNSDNIYGPSSDSLWLNFALSFEWIGRSSSQNPSRKKNGLPHICLTVKWSFCCFLQIGLQR